MSEMTAAHHIDPDDLRRLIEAGWTDRLIANRYGVSRTTVRGIRYRHNIKTRDPGRPPSVPITLVQQWFELLAMGKDEEAMESMTRALEDAR